MAKKTAPAPITESYCIGHGRMLPIEDFYKSINTYHINKVTPYCKNCANQMFKHYLKDYKSLEQACYITCADMGVPFIQKVFEDYLVKIKGYKSPENYFGSYMQYFYRQKRADLEKWVSFGATDVDFKDIAHIQQAKQSIQMAEEELAFIWGDDKTIEELQYLENRWEVYTKDKELEPFQEQLYRNLCKTELDIYENKDLDKAIQRQRAIAKDLGLDQFDKRQKQTEVEKMIEHDIMIMEQYEPAEYYKNKELYRDFEGIHKSWVKEILRPVLNLITGSKEYNIDGEQAEQYLERMEKEHGEKSEG